MAAGFCTEGIGEMQIGTSTPLAIFGDFGLVGGQDVAPNPLQNTQICVNFYAETDQANPKEVIGLLGCPGLIPLVSAPGGGAPGFSSSMTAWPQPSNVVNLPVRGSWELPGDTTALVVIGNTAYLLSVVTPATATSFPTFSLAAVGTLLTSTGPVSIRDNNAGGFAVIVDGPYGYLYSLNGMGGSTTASMGISGSSPVLDFVGSPNYQMVAGATVTDSLGYIPAGTIIISTNYDANSLTMSANATNSNGGDTITATWPAFMQIIDPAFLGADTVAFIDGWWIFNKPGSQTFFTNFPQYGTTFDGTYYALKDAATDNLVAVQENKEQLWLIGDKTTEIWYDAGGSYFPFQRLIGMLIQAGCKAKHSVSRINVGGQDCLIWFGRTERGENVILRSFGFNTVPVSNPAFGDEVATYPITSDAIGYTYQEDAHEFYVLTFPTADVSWCFDSQTGLLHKRLSYDPYAQQFHRHRSNCFMNFQGLRIVGDYQTGTLYQLTRKAYTDAGWPLLAQRRSPHVWDKGQRGRVFMVNLQLDFLPGVGNASGMGSNPQCTIAISRDGGQTFGQRWPAPLGQIGQTKTRTMWRRLGFGRDNVIDLQVIDPVRRDLIGATLKAFSA
jgi:hypothetical protein